MEHDHVFRYYPTFEEDGWQCRDCGYRRGFSPELDREQISDKIAGILYGLYYTQFFCATSENTNSSITASVAARCRREQRFDQYSIIQFIFQSDKGRHEGYWSFLAKKLLIEKEKQCAQS